MIRTISNLGPVPAGVNLIAPGAAAEAAFVLSARVSTCRRDRVIFESELITALTGKESLLSTTHRWDALRGLLDARERLTVEQAAEQLHVSAVTVRRDFAELERQGYLIRFRGGARRADSAPQRVSRMVEFRVDEQREAKLAIARAAASLIKDGDSVYMDSSSTVYSMIDHLTASNLVVVTNGYALIPKLVDRGITVYALNGFGMAGGAVLGRDTCNTIRHMSFNQAFLGAYGIDAYAGFTSYLDDEVDLKTMVIERANNTSILADHTKFSRRAFYTFAQPGSLPLITELPPPPDYPADLVTIADA